MTPDETEELILDIWDFDDPRGSYATFERYSEDAGTTTLPGLAFQTQMARALGLQDHHDGATTALDLVERDLKSFSDGKSRRHVQGRIEIERGRVLNSAGRPADSLPHFEAAADHAERAGTAGLVVDALHMVAIVVGQTESPEAAAQWSLRAIAAADASTDPAARRWLGSLHNNLGWVKHDSRAYGEALDHFLRALAAREESGTPEQVAIARWCVGRALRSLQRYPQALVVQDELAQNPLSLDDGYVHEERAECLLALGRREEAAQAFATAYELLSRDPSLAEREPERLQRLAGLATLGS